MADPQNDRLLELQRRLVDEFVDGALVTDPDSIFYLSRYWGYASYVSCARPNMIWIPRSGEPVMIVPAQEAEMCRFLSPIERVLEWRDGVDGEWRTPLAQILGQSSVKRIAIETFMVPGMISRFLNTEFVNTQLLDLDRILGAMRMIKGSDEIKIMRDAGKVAIAMCKAGQESIALGVPEYEVSLAVITGGTRKAAELLRGSGEDRMFSPMIHNLQILQSGHETCMVHRRPTTRRIEKGDPIYMCFCGILVFKGYWLGFDREYFCGSVTDEQARLYEISLEAQRRALGVIKPGVIAEEVHMTADAVYRDNGFDSSYRTGRGTGCSIRELPELKLGDKTILQPGMTFAVDGGITVPGRYGARVGDSIVVTEWGYEYLTSYPKELQVI